MMRVVLLLLFAIILAGCGPTMLQIKPSNPPQSPAPTDADLPRVHVFPLEKGSSFAELKPGVLNLDPDWTPEKKFVPSFATTDDPLVAIQDDVITALRQAGYPVTVGSTADGDAKFTIGGTLERFMVSTHFNSAIPGLVATALTGKFITSTGSDPMAVIYAGMNIQDTRSGISVPAPIIGADYSTLHLTTSQGGRRAIEKARRAFMKDLLGKFRQFQDALKAREARGKADSSATKPIRLIPEVDLTKAGTVTSSGNQ